MFSSSLNWLYLGIVGAAMPSSLFAATDLALDNVVVTATRTASDAFDLPASVDRIDSQSIRQGQWQENISEALSGIAGVSAQSRQNYAQDIQLSIRGFGARASFGTRGIRLYADGIPGTMPDGQGQFSHFDLGSAQRIEVLRGPFSALYGNSSGGVIAIFTEDGSPTPAYSLSTALGSFNSQRYALSASGRHGIMDFVINAHHFQSNGFREHSQAERNQVNSKLRWSFANQGQLTLLANGIDTPFVEDPLGLTAAQLANPSQAGTNALTYNTRKALRQWQAGIKYEQPMGDHLDWSALVYRGQRQTEQFQAILASAQTVAIHPGGVIDLERQYQGLDTRITSRQTIASMPTILTVGMAIDDLNEHRRGFQNFVGSELGVRGALRRDEKNRNDNVDGYLQGSIEPHPQWFVLAGVRHSEVSVSSVNRLLNQPRTTRRYRANNPVAGVTYRVSPTWRLYASYGRGFETPTLNELAYRSTDGTLPGLNLSLQPSRSEHSEAGIKARYPHWQAQAAWFSVDTRNELAVLASSGGRAVFQNVASTQRRGIEATVASTLAGGWRVDLAHTLIDATVTTPYITCSGQPCTTATVSAGSMLPAVPRRTWNIGLEWQDAQAHWHSRIDATRRSHMAVNDLNTALADGYWVSNVSLGLTHPFGPWQLDASVRIDNVLDEDYVGSVIVNDSNGRFFEPAPGRTWSVLTTLRFGNSQ